MTSAKDFDGFFRRRLLKTSGIASIALMFGGVGTGVADPGGGGVVHEDDFDPQGFFHITEQLDRTLTINCEGHAAETLHGYHIEYDCDATLEEGTLFARERNLPTDENLNYNWTRGARDCGAGPYVRSLFGEVGPS